MEPNYTYLSLEADNYFITELACQTCHGHHNACERCHGYGREPAVVDLDTFLRNVAIAGGLERAKQEGIAKGMDLAYSRAARML